MELERTANIAFMILLLIPVAVILTFLNLVVIREMNLNRRRKKGNAALSNPQPKKSGNVRKLHAVKRRPQDRKKPFSVELEKGLFIGVDKG